MINTAVGVGVLLLVVVVASGCEESHEQLQSAHETVEEYLKAAGGGAHDRGWSLLHPEVRRDMYGSDAAEYIAAAESSDWTRFQWSTIDVVKDEESLYQIIIEIEQDSIVPTVLTEHRNNYWLMWLVRGEPGPAQINVRVNAEGSGIFFFGG